MADARGFLAELLAKSVDPRALDARLDAGDQERLREFLRAYGDLDETLAYHGSDRAGYASGGMTTPGVKKPVRDFSELLGASFWREYMHWGELADQAAPMLQPVGGMDRIVDGFMRHVGDAVELRAAVREIRLGETGVEVAYSGARGEVRAVQADYCLNNMPAHLVVGLRHNLPARYVRALSAPGRGSLFKLAFQARRRFWEDEQIYGGISWTNQDITQIWYPPHGIHGGSGVILGAYAFDDEPGRRLTGLSPAQRIEAALAQGERGPPRVPAARGAGRQRGLVPHEPHPRLLDPVDRRGHAGPFRDAAEPRGAALHGGRPDQLPPGLAGRRHPVGLRMPSRTSTGAKREAGAAG